VPQSLQGIGAQGPKRWDQGGDAAGGQEYQHRGSVGHDIA
jgi:hypothetical protein